MTDPLNRAELLYGAAIGARRRVWAATGGRSHRWSADGTADDWGRDIGGACAELFAARELGVWWPGILAATGPDQGDDVAAYGVRWTPRRNGCLVLHHDDHDDRAFVLVTGDLPDLRIGGWLLAAEGKLPEHWRTDVRHPCFMVPQDALHQSVDDLKIAAGL